MNYDKTAYRIRPGHALHGGFEIQGSKNALLPILAACILRPGVVTLEHVPQISDKDAFCDILTALGCQITQNGHTLILDSTAMQPAAISPAMMQKTRGAFLLSGGMLARFHRFQASLPGGCRLGKRPIDYHLTALGEMGAVFTAEQAGHLCAKVDCLQGCEISLPFPSVGATQNILIAACGAVGQTVLSNAAIEPEVIELVRFLQRFGFAVHQTGVRTFTVIGAPEYCKTAAEIRFRISADRIAAVTYLCAAAATGGSIHLSGISLHEIADAAYYLRQAGCTLTARENGVFLTAPKRLHGIGEITTAPYPGFATDMQPLLMGMLCQSEGVSSFVETIFENRFSHAGELCQMGADIKLRQKTATVTGVPYLVGKELLAVDLRGGAALTIAALSAKGESILSGHPFIERGYEAFFEHLSSLGADIAPI